jgi:hypothetical protein
MDPLSGEIEWGSLEVGKYMLYQQPEEPSSAIKTSLITRMGLTKKSDIVK